MLILHCLTCTARDIPDIQCLSGTKLLGDPGDFAALNSATRSPQLIISIKWNARAITGLVSATIKAVQRDPLQIFSEISAFELNGGTL